MANDALARRFLAPDALGTTLVTIAWDTFGPEVAEWDGEALEAECADTFGGVPGEAALGRLHAALYVLVTDRFYHELPTFLEICSVLAGGVLDPTVWSPPDVDEIAWGITEAALLAPPEGELVFAPDIRHFLGHACDREGLLDPPDVLAMAIRGRPGHPWGDDPARAAAIDREQAAKSRAITDYLDANLTALAAQLDGLPLAHGNTATLVAKVRTFLARGRH